MIRETYTRFGPIRSNLKVKVTLGIVLPLLLILGGITAAQVLRHQAAVLHSAAIIAANAGKVVEEGLRQEILESHFDPMPPLLERLSQPGAFRVVYLLDNAGTILFSPDTQDIGVQISAERPNCQPCHGLPADERLLPSVVVDKDSGERVFRSMILVQNTPECASCHEIDGQPLALLVTDTSMTALDASLRTNFYESLLWLAIIVIVTVGVVNFALNQFIIARVTALAQALDGFGRGKRDLRLPAGAPDEIGQLADAFNEMGQRVESEEAENKALSENLRQQYALRGQLLKKLLTAQEDERKRLAREIHDDLGQSMAGLAFQAEVLQRFLPPGEKQASTQLNQIQDLIQTTSDSMYDLILALRPSGLDDLGLVIALRTHAERVFDGTGIEFEINAETFEGRLPSEIEIAIYRLFQEALNNIIRHASAKHVYLQLTRHNGVFEGKIEDDGRGFNPEEVHLYREQPRGLGLLGMQERVEQFGGTLDISSQYGNGTIIKIRIPFQFDQREAKSHE